MFTVNTDKPTMKKHTKPLYDNKSEPVLCNVAALMSVDSISQSIMITNLFLQLHYKQ